MNLNIYWAFAEGFIKETAATLTEAEVETLGTSCFALACELATRFLDDYILGISTSRSIIPTTTSSALAARSRWRRICGRRWTP